MKNCRGAALIAGVLAFLLITVVTHQIKPEEEAVPLPTVPVHILPVEEEEKSIAWVKYPVPIGDEVQEAIYRACTEFGVPAHIAYAVMGVETGYDPELIGDGGNAVGIMQIHPIYYLDKIEDLGITDLQDTEQNARLGISILGDLYATGKDTAWVLMAYNGGTAYADEAETLGRVSSYAEKVMEWGERLDEAAVIMGE